jgi:tetratricopeptide (TPR) repeat protein
VGEREPDPAKLEEAIAVFRAALLEHKREVVPLDWAGTLLNLGTALANLGDRTKRAADLKEAVETYRLALLEFRREVVPLNWAMVQNNLGTALRILGALEGDVAYLVDADEAFRGAIEVAESIGHVRLLELARWGLRRTQELLLRRT